MNTYFLVAGILCFVLGLGHSILGEYLIFKEKRNKGQLIPSKTGTGLKERHLRIIWATWHLTSLFGWCIGALLVKIAIEKNRQVTELTDFLITSARYTMLTSSILVLVATKGKHPGWVVLLFIGLLLIIGKT
ncbi:hypothetical protein [Roseivirga sp.]|uniref:hypothetical protein n=1 Tax=Roseivirga sp. TaxID=1964215 RepID=UPI002B27BAE5|nr:hypothetical protein [Roseivirga sp.]